ncbi:MAG: amino acid ABC transporter permease, partial [Pseudomonadota bacterium]
MYHDTVKNEKFVHKPLFILGLFTFFFLLLLIFKIGDSAFAHWILPITGAELDQDDKSGWYGHFASALILAILVTVNIVLIGFLNTRTQILVVWAELTILAFAFFALFDLSLEFIQSKIWFLITQGALTTIYVSAVSIVLACIIAIIGAIAKLSGNGFAFAIASFYVSFFRGLPLLMQLYLIYLGLPQLGFIIDAVPAGIAALSLCYGAYMTEIFRSGIQSISRGQWEGARALGLNFNLTMRRVILPQSFPLIVPPTG